MTPLPSRERLSVVFAVVNSALRTASMRRQSRGSSFLYFSNHSATAAAICGVADDVPPPFSRTASVQPYLAHGMFGVYAERAAFMTLSGPKLPSIVLSPGNPAYGCPLAMTPHAAMTRPNRAGYTMCRVGIPLKLLPAAATRHRPAR